MTAQRVSQQGYAGVPRRRNIYGANRYAPSLGAPLSPPPAFVSSSFNTTGVATDGVPTIVVNAPASLVQGNLLVAHCSCTYNNSVVVPPAGWTQFLNSLGGKLELFYKYVTNSEPASYTWGIGPTLHGRFIVSILQYSGVDQSTPIESVAVNQPGVQTVSVDSPSIVTTKRDAVAIVFDGLNGTTYTGPTGSPAPTLRLSVPASTLNIMGSYDVQQAAPGASSVYTVTNTGSSNQNMVAAAYGIRPP